MNDQNQPPTTIVIFGASGDLAHRKLVPSLFSLFCKKRLPENFNIVGFAINDWDTTDFSRSLREGVDKFAGHSFSDDDWKQFASHLSYMKGNFTTPEDFEKLNSLLETVEKGPVGRIYYMATPPQFFPSIALNLGQAGMSSEKDGWRRILIEKPFGSDLKTAKELNSTLHKVFKEDQIYRIDHYLGKETVQNLMIFRFANTIFEPIWNREYIDHVQISVLEDLGVEHRGGYYDKAGVVRDMFQNHIMQLLMLVAIEPPDTLRHEDLHKRKLEVLRSLRPINGKDVDENTVRGQYNGYRQEPGVDPNSHTATYAAIRAFIDNPRWKGVPFYLRSGKNLTKKCTEIIIQFDCPKFAVLPMPPSEEIVPNILAICIQPDEGIFLRFEAKVPDTEADIRSVEMEFHYSTSFGGTSIPEAYERLILEAIQGDHTLFNPDDVTEMSWKWIDPILEEWQNPQAEPMENYEPHTWGPKAADLLMHKDGCEWQITCGKHNDNQ
jgi:glucose-6-phosphate 1-dehydrogenase